MSQNLVKTFKAFEPQKNVFIREDRLYAKGAVIKGTAGTTIPAGTIVTGTNFYLTGTPTVAVGQGASAVGVLVNDVVFNANETEKDVSVAYYNAVVDVTKIPTQPTDATITALAGKVSFVKGE